MIIHHPGMQYFAGIMEMWVLILKQLAALQMFSFAKASYFKRPDLNRPFYRALHMAPTYFLFVCFTDVNMYTVLNEKRKWQMRWKSQSPTAVEHCWDKVIKQQEV